jgi:hypothetical protein
VYQRGDILATKFLYVLYVTQNYFLNNDKERADERHLKRQSHEKVCEIMTMGHLQFINFENRPFNIASIVQTGGLSM